MTTTFQPTPTDAPDAVRMLESYFHARELGFTRIDRHYTITHPDPAAFLPPSGVFLIASDERGVAIGCGGIKAIATPASFEERGDALVYEVKHVWVDPGARGAGVGTSLIGELERRALEFGASDLVLDTHVSLVNAAKLYHRRGFSPIAAYNDNPNATNWYRKPLVPVD